MSEYKAAFFIVPARIMNLPGLTLSFLKFYETIFQFWNHRKNCHLSNASLKERTGITSSSTIQEAFEFFAHHNEMLRIVKNGHRYIEQPPQSVEFDYSNDEDNDQELNKKSAQNPVTPLAVARPPSRCSETPPLAVARHNNKKLNKKNINKERTKNICATENIAQSRFDEFWNVYPKKKDKEKARQIWVKRKYDTISSMIIADIKNRILNESSWKNDQFIPYPSTYLRNKRWEDELTLAQNAQKKESGSERALRMCINQTVN